jgi:hypothetical protein
MVNPITDDSTFVQQVEKARIASARANATEPRAIAASYDPVNCLIIIHLKSGAIFSFPPDIAQGLANAVAEDLAEIEITPNGEGLHWSKLDADFTVSGLMMGLFGSKRWMAELHRQWATEQVS